MHQTQPQQLRPLALAAVKATGPTAAPGALTALRRDLRNHREDLRNSFHRPKIDFPCYDGDSDPLPWLNQYESDFMGTRTLQDKQDGAAAEWYYVLEREYGLLPWVRFIEFINL
jgi:hypothetical protein